ncbi:hypothetical protein, partial [Aneurinibacillus danicus]|uniref:hypothetical protein n=1 Tax=Aneurinibacillus danicus TaxID=267746 RepID=UPI001C3F5883
HGGFLLIYRPQVLSSLYPAVKIAPSTRNVTPKIIAIFYVSSPKSTFHFIIPHILTIGTYGNTVILTKFVRLQLEKHRWICYSERD